MKKNKTPLVHPTHEDSLIPDYEDQDKSIFTLDEIDPFEDERIRQLPPNDQAALITQSDPTSPYLDKDFQTLDPKSQRQVLQYKFPAFRTLEPVQQQQFLGALRQQAGLAPFPDEPTSIGGRLSKEAISKATEALTQVESAVKTPTDIIPQEYKDAGQNILEGVGEALQIPQRHALGSAKWLKEHLTSDTPGPYQPLSWWDLTGKPEENVFDPKSLTFTGTGGQLLTDPLNYLPGALAKLGGRKPVIPPMGPPTAASAPTLRDLAQQARESMYTKSNAPLTRSIVPDATTVRGPQYSTEPSITLPQPESVKQSGAGSLGGYKLTGSPTPEGMKPGFLETAEERARRLAPLPTAEDLLKQRLEAQAGLTVDDLIRPDVAAARQRAYQAALREREANPRPPWYQQADPELRAYVDKQENMVSPANDLKDGAPFRIGRGDVVEFAPSWFSKAFDPALDALARMGPKGGELSTLLRDYLNGVERKTSHVMMNVDADFARIWGRRGYWSQKHERGYNAWKSYTMSDLYNISREDVDQLVDYLYTSGRIKPTGANAEKIIETADSYFQKGTRPVSSHEGVKMIPGRMMPDGTIHHVGDPSMFLPQQPLAAARRQLLDDRHLHDLYVASVKRGFKGSFDDYKDNMNKYLDRGAEQGDIKSARFGGWENSREFHADDFGRPSQVLREYGYNSDPLRALFQYASGGYRRGDGLLLEKHANDLVNQIEREVPNSRYARTAVSRTIGVESQDVIDRLMPGFISKVIAANDASLLQLAALPQFNQMAFVVGRAGVMDTAKGITRWWREGPTGIPSHSGAMFTRFMNEFVTPRSRVGQFAVGSLRATGFPAADDWVRLVGAFVGEDHLRKMALKYIAEPSNMKVENIIRSLGVDPKEVLERASVITKYPTTPWSDIRTLEDMAEKGAQSFANLTSGVRDVRTLPLWLTSNDPLIRLIAQYKKFLFNNAGEMIRQYRLYGPWTAGATAGTAIGIGEVTRDVQYMLTHLESPGFPAGGYENEKRIAKPFRGAHAYSPLAARAIDDLVFGLGSIYFMLAYSALEGDPLRMAEMGMPAIGWVEPLAHAGGLFTPSTPENQHPAKPFARDVSRRLPIVGPVMPRLVQDWLPASDPRVIKPIRPIKPFPEYK